GTRGLRSVPLFGPDGMIPSAYHTSERLRSDVPLGYRRYVGTLSSRRKRSERMSDVLVAGGGTVGLAAAVMLARQGLRVEVVERQPSPSIHPRAGGLGPRTLEILRQLGLADQVRAAGVAPDAGSGRVSAETLAAANLPSRPRGAAKPAIGDASKV